MWIFLLFLYGAIQMAIRQWTFTQLLEAKFNKAYAYLFACTVGTVIYILIWGLQPYVRVNLMPIRGAGVLLVEWFLLFKFYKGKWTYKVFLWISSWVFFQIADIMAWALARYYLGYQIEPAFSPDVTMIAGYSIYNVIAFALISIYVLFMKRMRNHFVFKKATLLYFFFPLLQTTFIFLLFSTIAPVVTSVRHMFMLLLMSGAGLISSLIVLQSFDSFSQKEYLAARLNIVEDLQKSEYGFYLQAQEYVREMNIIRHDFNDQLQTIQCLISEDTSESKNQADELINAVHERLVQTHRLQYCENEVANAVFCVNAEKTQKEGIQFTVKADIPKELAVRPVDLCGVLSNLLSNAIEACSELDGDCFTDVAVCQKNEFLHIHVANSCFHAPGKVKKQRRSKNISDRPRGYGMMIIDSIANRYDGLYQREIRDNVFLSDVLLKIE